MVKFPLLLYDYDIYKGGISLKSKLYLTLSLLLGLYLIYGVISAITKLSEYRTADAVVLLIMFVIFGLLEFLFIKKYKKYSDPEFKRHEKEKNDNETRLRKEATQKAASEKLEQQRLVPGSKERKLSLEADICINVKHMAGLPVAEGAEIFVYRCKDKVIFERNQDTYELEASNMKDILIKTDVEIQKNHVSSIGGAVGGYVLFGPLGAMVGGRSKEKKSTIIEKYLIFDYVNKEGIQDFISFEVTNEPNAILFNTNHFNLTKNERTKVSL